MRRRRPAGGGRPLPRRPYRDSALLYGALAMIVVLISWATDGDLVRALVVAAVFFLVATAWSWWRFRERTRAERRKAS